MVENIAKIKWRNKGIIYENIAQQKINNPTGYVKSETSATYDMYKNQILHESNPTKLVDILGRASDDSKISNYEYASLYKIAISNPAYPISEEEYLKNELDPDYVPEFEGEGWFIPYKVKDIYIITMG